MLCKTLGDLYSYCCYHYSEKTAIVYETQRYTFLNLEENATRLSNSLLSIGINKGESLAQLMPNCPETIFCDYACCKIGLSRIPLGTYLKSKDIIYMMREANVKAIIYDKSLQKEVRYVKEVLPNVKYIYRSDDASTIPKGDYDLQTMLLKGSLTPVKIGKINENDIATISFTGGTTGMPKGVVHTHRTRVTMVCLELMHWGISQNENFLICTPLSHAAGSIVLAVLLKGGCCVIMQGFELKEFLHKIESEKITTTFLVPTQIYILLDDQRIDIGEYNTITLRNIIYGGSAINPERLKEAITIFGSIFTQVFGQTEAPMTISVLSMEEHIIDDKINAAYSRLASCGRPTLSTDTKILDDHGNELDVGQAGELVLRSPMVMKEYLNRPGLTAETIINGWLHTGDIARKDGQGYIYIVDRKKDMIVTGGLNVYPAEIEKVINEHLSVSVSAVVGIPDPKWGEAISAIVKLKPGKYVSEDEIINLCKKAKGSISAPKSVSFVKNIPVTNLGKPDKKLIRENYWEYYSRKV